ncbi:MAG TPA: hypothetical protein VEX62_11470 [Candidatus Limnocylindrales bacterium]|nr:hypothetical protein [Candidatus Limnocylindrales bacterium]
MAKPSVLIFHRPAAAGEPSLVHELAAVRLELAERQSRLLERAGAASATFIDEWRDGLTFGEVLAEVAPARGGVIVFGSGAVPRLNRSDARRLVEVAATGKRRALTNNRFSSDIVAIGRSVLAELPPLPSDNALPRWLEERAEFVVDELPGKQRLALDLDTPLDVALAALGPGAAGWLVDAARDRAWTVPRFDKLRLLAADPHAELLVFGRSGSTTLRWLERNVRCRVRFLAEERGMRASSPLAIDAPRQTEATGRAGPRATLGMLLDDRGPSALAAIVDELADGAIIDSRVLLAHRLGADESGWPSPADRFASDLLLTDRVEDSWLGELTRAAAEARPPILLGGHSLVGPGVPLLLGRASRA